MERCDGEEGDKEKQEKVTARERREGEDTGRMVRIRDADLLVSAEHFWYV